MRFTLTLLYLERFEFVGACRCKGDALKIYQDILKQFQEVKSYLFDLYFLQWFWIKMLVWIVSRPTLPFKYMGYFIFFFPSQVLGYHGFALLPCYLSFTAQIFFSGVPSPQPLSVYSNPWPYCILGCLSFIFATDFRHQVLLFRLTVGNISKMRKHCKRFYQK